jgi:hypothetical protein
MTEDVDILVARGVTVMDIKSRGQPACQEEQKTCKEESVNVMHECDV